MLKRFIYYYKPHKKMLALDMLASLLISVIGMVYPIVTNKMLNIYIPEKMYTTIVAAGLIVLAGDIVKTILAIVVCELLFGKSHPQEVYLLKLYAAAGAILGHNFPFYLKFKGGKGIASTAGLVLAFHPLFIPVGVLVFFGIFFTTHYVSLGSLLVYVGITAEMVIMGQMGFFGAPQGILNEMYIVTILLAAMAYYKHRENIGRLLKGQERKTYLTKKNEDK